MKRERKVSTTKSFKKIQAQDRLFVNMDIAEKVIHRGSCPSIHVRDFDVKVMQNSEKNGRYVRIRRIEDAPRGSRPCKRCRPEDRLRP